jgi:hypothetical protein
MIIVLWHVRRKSQSQSHIWLTVGQSVSLGVEPHLGLMTRYLLLFDCYGFVFVGRRLWREDGSGPRQRSLSRVRFPWISQSYFTVSVLRLPFSSPPTTRRVTVEVFDPASTPARIKTRYIASWRKPQKTKFLADALLQRDVAVTAERIENSASNSSSIVVYARVAAVTWRLPSHCLATDVSSD